MWPNASRKRLPSASTRKLPSLRSTSQKNLTAPPQPPWSPSLAFIAVLTGPGTLVFIAGTMRSSSMAGTPNM